MPGQASDDLGAQCAAVLVVLLDEFGLERRGMAMAMAIDDGRGRLGGEGGGVVVVIGFGERSGWVQWCRNSRHDASLLSMGHYVNPSKPPWLAPGDRLRSPRLCSPARTGRSRSQ
ncbi:hypothetical protein D3C81_1454980 [compost metagenome]